MAAQVRLSLHLSKRHIVGNHMSRLMLISTLGGYSYFFRIRRLGPSIYCSHPKNIRNFKHPQKIFEILATQNNISILYLDLKKTLNCIEMTLKLAQFCDHPKKNILKIFIPPKIFIFLKTPKNIEIQNFEPQKIARAYVCVKISEYPPPPPWDLNSLLQQGSCF